MAPDGFIDRLGCLAQPTANFYNKIGQMLAFSITVVSRFQIIHAMDGR